jgi:DedD protein
MSRQQTRSSGDGAIDPSLVQKKRARHRLVGAICLSLLAALVVPLVLESEPRPRDRDLPLELATPARNAAEKTGDKSAAEKPGDKVGGRTAAGSSDGGPGSPATPAVSSGAVTSGAIGNLASQNPSTAAVPPRADAAADAKSAVKTITPPVAGAGTPSPGTPLPGTPSAGMPSAATPPSAARQPPRTDPAKPATLPLAPPVAEKPPLAQDKPPTRSGEPDVLARLIERTDGPAGGQPATKAAASRKFLVQIGAYSNVQSARSVSDRATEVGLRPYQETVKTAQGDWIRVRVGPFTTRQDAERAQQDLKRAGVTAAIIAL